MNLIAAVDSKFGIGRDNKLLVSIPEDMKFFRSTTMDKTVILGRRTLESFPNGAPLKRRRNIVLTRKDIEIPGAEVAHSTEEALSLAAKYEKCYVIGGASVFRQFFPYLDRVELTKIDLAPPSDSYFPDLDRSPEWECTEAGPWFEEDGVSYCFCTYRRLKKQEE